MRISSSHVGRLCTPRTDRGLRVQGACKALAVTARGPLSTWKAQRSTSLLGMTLAPSRGCHTCSLVLDDPFETRRESSSVHGGCIQSQRDVRGRLRRSSWRCDLRRLRLERPRRPHLLTLPGRPLAQWASYERQGRIARCQSSSRACADPASQVERA